MHVDNLADVENLINMAMGSDRGYIQFNEDRLKLRDHEGQGR